MLLGDSEHVVDVDRVGEEVVVTFADAAPGEGTYRLSSGWKPGDVLWSGTVNGRPVAVHVRPLANGFELAHRGVEAKAYVFTEREAAAVRLMPINKMADSGKAVRCPMPGLVVSIAVSEGEEVKAGQELAVIEAMKMENILRAATDGRVAKVLATAGNGVEVDQPILEFEA